MPSSAETMLTPAQRKALDLSRHLCVTANAGSGKTRVLVERYVRILREDRATPQEIVALTFTEKAAGELRRRISDTVAAGIAEGPVRRELLRAGLSAAFIGTIHGYCAHLLREFPVEAGVDAGFAVLEGIDRHLMLEESLHDTFRAILRGNGEHPLRASLARVVREIGKGPTQRIVTLLVDRREILQRWDEEGRLYAAGDDSLCATWDAAIRGFVARELASDQLREDLRALTAEASGKERNRAQELVEEVLADGPLEHRVYALLAAAETMVTKEGALLRSFAGNGTPNPATGAASTRLARWRTTLAPLGRHILGEKGDHDRLLTLTRTLIAAGSEAQQRYRRRKNEAGVLDFDDLQLEVRQLLNEEPVRRRLCERVKYLLVDEYQDTSRVQRDLLLPLTDGLRSGNLFIVGDPKQSIYGFRNADVRVFEQTRADILVSSGGEGDVLLGESFRPLRDLAGFTNRLFPTIMKPGSPAEGGLPATSGVRYDPLIRARQGKSTGRVELILASGTESIDSAEPELVARRIVRLVSSGETCEAPDGTIRPITWRDISVLMRTRTALPQLEEALFRSGVPYAVSAGVGYFQTQDVLDVYNYFRFLADPSDDAALAGVLRSPFFLVSDAELLESAMTRSQGTLWVFLAGRARSKDTPESLRRAVETLGADLALAPTLSTPEVLERIVRQASYEAILAASPRGAQGAANLDKLRRLALAFDRQGLVSLYDFAQRLGRLVEQEEKEGQASASPPENAVQVMTIHAAKGLEFPVVVLPGLHRPFMVDGTPFIDEDLGIGFTLDGAEGDKLQLPAVDLMREAARERTAAEEVRILYVGVTRARDMLIMSADVTRRADNRSPIRWILDSFGTGEDVAGEAIPFPCVTETLFLKRGEFVGGIEESEVSVHVVRAPDLPRSSAGREGERVDVAARSLNIEPLVSLPRGEIYSATRLRTYLECPAGYFLRYVLGFPERPPAPREDLEGDSADLPADLIGRLFHAVMERIGTGPVNQEDLSALCARAFDLEGDAAHVNREEVIGHVSSLVGGVTRCQLWKEILSGTDTRTEFTLSIPLDTEFLTGTIDRTYVDSAGRRVVLDYKTDVVEENTIAEAAQRHRPQLAVYALLAQSYFGVDAVRTILLFARAPDKPVERVYTAADLGTFQGEVRQVFRRIREGDFPASPRTCSACPLGRSRCEEAMKGIRI